MKRTLCILFCCGAVAVLTRTGTGMAEDTAKTEIQKIPYGVMEAARVPVSYAGSETFRYEIAYTGGVKLGELELELRKVPGEKDHIELHALVTTEDSVFNTIYPVHDVHVTRVSGEERLPYSYEVWQKEGFNYEAHRMTLYDQAGGTINYRKNDKQPVSYQVATPIHNEFSSFFASRLMPFAIGKSFLVPTFADKKRAEVEVKVLKKERLKKTALGSVETFRVSPILKFKGLYDKRGDTTIWYTDDECRVPVKITSKLAIGSVTAKLLSYANPYCGRYAKITEADN